MTSTLPTDAVHADERPGDAWFSCGARALEEWKKRLGLGVRDIAAKVGCANGSISNWIRGERIPLDGQRRVIEEVTGGEVPASWWFWWTLGAGLEDDRPSRSAPAPVSEKKPVAKRRELGSTHGELVGTVQEIDIALQGSDLADTARANLLGKRTSALVAIARIENNGALKDHPEFEAHKEDIKAALRDLITTHGIDLAAGIRTFRDALVKHERARTRKAA